MADNVPIPPGGAMPPKPAEAAKVQPKKETVRINLPPKPTSAPTIKLPTLAPGTPPHASGTAAAAPVAVAVATAAPAAKAAPSAPPASAAPARAAAAAATSSSVKAATAPAPVPRPMAAPLVVGVSGLDRGLAVAAAVISLGALGCVAYLAFMLKDTV